MKTRTRLPEPTPDQVEEIRAVIRRLRELGQFFGDHDPDDSYDAGDD